MAVSMIGPKFYAWDRNGKPLAFGKVYTYQARTNSPKPTYQSEDQKVENTNPVILNGEGYANIYLAGSYKIVLKDSDDNEIWSADPVSEAAAGNGLTYVLTAYYLTSSSFKVLGDHLSVMVEGARVEIGFITNTSKQSTVITSGFDGTFTTVEVEDSIIRTDINTASLPTGMSAIADFNDISQEQLENQEKSFQERFALSQPALPWEPLTLIADELQLYSTGIIGESGYSVWLADPSQLPFTTSATFTEDEALNRWAAATVATQEFVEEFVSENSTSDLEAIALSLNTPKENVTYDTAGEIVASYIYSPSQQKTYSVPADALGKTIDSVVGSTLNTVEAGGPYLLFEADAGSKTSKRVVSSYDLTGYVPTSSIEVTTTSYHPHSATVAPFGGASYVWRSDLAKSLHDGGQFISPTVPNITAQGGGITGTILFIAATGENDGAGLGVWKLKDDGWVSAEQYGSVNSILDQTAIISAALASGLNVKHEEKGATIGYSGAKLYIRSGQTLQGQGRLGGTKYRMADGLDLSLTENIGYCFERESRSHIFDLEIDGNNAAYEAFVNALIPFANTPECGGVYTSRFFTNGSVYSRGDESFDDRLHIHNTIRTSYVFSGNNNNAGTLELRNSHCDHYLYFSQSRQCRAEVVHTSGTFREECVVFSTSGGAPALDCSVGKLVMDAPLNSSYPSDNTLRRWVHFRGSLEEGVVPSNVIEELTVNDTTSIGATQELFRQLSVGDGAVGRIDKCILNTYRQEGAVLVNNSDCVFNFGTLEVNLTGESALGAMSSMDILFTRATIAGRVSILDVETFTLRSDVANAGGLRAMTNASSQFRCGRYIHDVDGGTAVRMTTDVQDATFVVTSYSQKQAPTLFLNPTYNIGSPTFKGASGSAINVSSGSPALGWDNYFNLTGTAGQIVTAFSRSANGQNVSVVGNGVASIAHNTAIKLKGGVNVVIPVDTIMRLEKINGVFYEI